VAVLITKRTVRGRPMIMGMADGRYVPALSVSLVDGWLIRGQAMGLGRAARRA
jgi:hypothetical protein